MVTCEGKIVHQHKVSQQCLVKYWHRKNAQTNRVGAVTLHTEHTWLHAGHESSKSSDKLSFYDELATCPGCTLPSPYDAGIGSSPPATPNGIKQQKMNE